jgi:1-phosphatidylinositol-4-phosphate 5-kinase
MGYATGQGKFTDSLGNQYIGNFSLSMAHGKGTYTNTLGAVYDGDWRYDMQHGVGIEKWTGSGSTFKGNFAEGLR